MSLLSFGGAGALLLTRLEAYLPRLARWKPPKVGSCNGPALHLILVCGRESYMYLFLTHVPYLQSYLSLLLFGRSFIISSHPG